MIRHSVWMFAMAVAFMGQAHAQQYVYPAKGQSPEQQKNDEAACYSWAVQPLLGHTKLESAVRYLGIEVDDALEMAEQTEV